MIVATFCKRHFDYPMHQCFYCSQKPEGVMTFKLSGDIIRVCEKCFNLHRKRRKTAKLMSDSQSKPSQIKKPEINEGENRQTTLEIGKSAEGLISEGSTND